MEKKELMIRLLDGCKSLISVKKPSDEKKNTASKDNEFVKMLRQMKKKESYEGMLIGGWGQHPWRNTWDDRIDKFRQEYRELYNDIEKNILDIAGKMFYTYFDPHTTDKELIEKRNNIYLSDLVNPKFLLEAYDKPEAMRDFVNCAGSAYNRDRHSQKMTIGFFLRRLKNLISEIEGVFIDKFPSMKGLREGNEDDWFYYSNKIKGTCQEHRKSDLPSHEREKAVSDIDEIRKSHLDKMLDPLMAMDGIECVYTSNQKEYIEYRVDVFMKGRSEKDLQEKYAIIFNHTAKTYCCEGYSKSRIELSYDDGKEVYSQSARFYYFERYQPSELDEELVDIRHKKLENKESNSKQLK